MSDTLGDRIRAKRDRAHSGPREAAKAWAQTYIDHQIKQIKKVLKEYIDNRIAKLAADNNLINND